jgi:hypothetical protein
MSHVGSGMWETIRGVLWWVKRFVRYTHACQLSGAFREVGWIHGFYSFDAIDMG